MENSKNEYLVIKGETDLSIWNEIQDLAKATADDRVKAVRLLFDNYRVVPDNADELLLNLAGQENFVKVRREIAKGLAKKTGIPWVLHVKVLEVLSKDEDKQVQDAVKPMRESYQKIIDSFAPKLQELSALMKNMIPPKLFADIANIPQLTIPADIIENLKKQTTLIMPDLILPLAEQIKKVQLPDFSKIYSDSLLNISTSQVNFFKNALQVVPSYSYFPAEKELEAIRVTENPLVFKLRSIPTGQRNWHDYQGVCKAIIDYCFVPPLLEPFEESINQDGIHRRDIVYPIPGGISGFWGYIQTTYSAKAVIIDAKNYKDELPKDQVVIISKYFGEKKLGNFGIIVSRKGPSRSARKEQIDRWVHHEEMILCLSDDDLGAMLAMKGENSDPEKMLDKKIFEIKKSV